MYIIYTNQKLYSRLILSSRLSAIHVCRIAIDATVTTIISDKFPDNNLNETREGQTVTTHNNISYCLYSYSCNDLVVLVFF